MTGLAVITRDVTDEAGNLLDGAQVTIRVGHVGGGALATIYADAAGATAIANPVTLDGLSDGSPAAGQIQVYAEPGLYRLEGTGAAGVGFSLVDTTSLGWAGAIYDSRAEAIASSPLAVIVKIEIKTPAGDTLAFKRDASGTALTTADGQNWSPDGDVTPGHYAENTTPGTTDMTTALQAACTYLHSLGGGELKINGTYVCNGLIIPDNVLVGGSGWQATTLKATTDTFVVRIGDGTANHNAGGLQDVTLRGFWNQVIGERTNSHGVIVTKSNRSRVHNVRAFSCHDGFTFIESGDVDVSNCHCNGGGADRTNRGWVMPEQDISAVRNAVVAKGCFMINCITESFLLTMGSGSKFFGCEAYGPLDNSGADIQFKIGNPVGATPAPVEYMYFESCLADQPGLGGFDVRKGTGPNLKGLVFEGCWAGGCEVGATPAFYIEGADRNCVINGLTSDSVNGDAIYAKDCTGLTITGASIAGYNADGGGRRGIVLDNSDECTVTGNTVATTVLTGTPRSIVEINGSDNNVIVGNGAKNGGVILGANSKWAQNVGIKTEGRGTIVLPLDTASVVVTHGLAFTPTASEINVKLTQNVDLTLYADTFTSTQFTIRSTNATHPATVIAWDAQRIVA